MSPTVATINSTSNSSLTRSAALRGSGPRRTGTRFCPRRNGDASSSSRSRTRASSGESSYERDEVRGSGAASKSSSGNVEVVLRAMKAVNLPRISAIRLTISGFFGSAAALFAAFAGMYFIRKQLRAQLVSAGAELMWRLRDRGVPDAGRYDDQ